MFVEDVASTFNRRLKIILKSLASSARFLLVPASHLILSAVRILTPELVLSPAVSGSSNVCRGCKQ